MEFFSHELREGGKLIRGFGCSRTGLSRDSIKGSQCEIALRFECVDPFLQVIIKIDDSILDRAIQPIEFVLSRGEFYLQRPPAIIDCAALCTLTFQEGL